MMNKRPLNLLLCVAVPCSCSLPAYTRQSSKREKKTKPNVIIILVDDLGYGDLECYGTTRVHTPNVDRLAPKGIRFTNVHATTSTSTPSRYISLTGEYAWRKKGTEVAAGNAGMIIRPERYTIADIFKSTGYTTGAIGKRYLGLGGKTGTQDWDGTISPALRDVGFNCSYIMAVTADRIPYIHIENGRVVDYDFTAPTEASYQKSFEGEPAGKKNPESLYNLKPNHGHDMAIVNSISCIGYMKGRGKALWKDEDITGAITSHAIRFIEENEERPLFPCFAINDVHAPRFPHECLRSKDPMGLRGGAIVQFGWSVGEIMKTLDRLGLTENTLITLPSDNGPVLDDGCDDKAVELAGSHKPGGLLRGRECSAFEAGACISAIVRYPAQVKENQTLNTLLSRIDWIQSLASLVDVAIPRSKASDSQNHLDSWLGKSKKDRPWAIEGSNILASSVCKGKWKHIGPFNGSPMIAWGLKIETGYVPYDQLLDMGKSGFEGEDLVPKYPAVVKEVEDILMQERAKGKK